MKRKLISNLAQILLVVVVFMLVSQWMNDGLLEKESQAPPFHLYDVQAQLFDSRDIQKQDRAMVLFFWATWCSVCKVNLPIIHRMQSWLPDDVLFLSVVVDAQNQRKVARFVAEREIKIPVLLGDTALAEQYRVERYPTTYFVNAQGQIAATDSGLLTPMGLWFRAMLFLR